VRLGIISNADGLIGQRLAEQEILQVGPGAGVDVECVIDSGAVGVMKPDPRIFQLATDAMGIDAADAWYVGDMPGIDVVGARAAGMHPVLMDPYSLHLSEDYDRTSSLAELAATIAAAS
jgi:putative hydrolase of the HAD superfamily